MTGPLGTGGPVKGARIAEGKAKILYRTDMEGQVLMEFTDQATALDGGKTGFIGGKGQVNAEVSAHLFSMLTERGIPNHFIQQMDASTLLVREIDIIPVEVVVRNIVAGSLARRLGVEEGQRLARPVLEFYLKDDSLNDPLINTYHALALELAASSELGFIEEEAWRVNSVLGDFLLDCGLVLVDFKLEFGRTGSQVILGDEISPDTCRLWDKDSGSRLDKDLFRRDLGGAEAAYQEVLERVRRGRGLDVQS